MEGSSHPLSVPWLSCRLSTYGQTEDDDSNTAANTRILQLQFQKSCECCLEHLSSVDDLGIGRHWFPAPRGGRPPSPHFTSQPLRETHWAQSGFSSDPPYKGIPYISGDFPVGVSTLSIPSCFARKDPIKSFSDGDNSFRGSSMTSSDLDHRCSDLTRPKPGLLGGGGAQLTGSGG